MASISLTMPWMLAGLSMLALPVAAHLYHRRAVRRVVFPTITLLVDASANCSWYLRLRGPLLLLLRCLAVIFVTLAFTQPVWHVSDSSPGGLAVSGNSGSRPGVVILLDQSASTRTLSDGVVLYERLRADAARALNRVSADVSLSGVIYAKSTPASLRETMSGHSEALRAAVEGSAPTYEHADMPAALLLAGELLAEVQGDRRLMIFTDLQGSDWSDTTAIRAAAEQLPTGTSITVMPTAGPDPDNASVRIVSRTPDVPVVGAPVRVVVGVTNHGSSERDIPVTLHGNNFTPDPITLRIPSGASREAIFEIRFHMAGLQWLHAAIPADALDADNTAYAALLVTRQPSVLLITDDSNKSPGSDGYFISRALTPHGNSADAYTLNILTPAQAASDSEALRGSRIVIIAGAETLPIPLQRSLIEHLGRGGGTIFFCGSRTPLSDLASFDTLAPGGVLPFEPNQPLSARTSFIAAARWTDEPLRDFGPAAQQLFSSIRFSRTWTAGNVHNNAVLWMTYDDGRPALAARRVGDAVCVVANFGLASSDSDLAGAAPIVALIHSLVSFASRPEARHEHFPGEPLRLAIPSAMRSKPGALSLQGPSGTLDYALHETGADGVTLHLQSIPQPGLYSVAIGNEPAVIGAVNLDSRESDPRRIDPDELQRTLTTNGITVNDFASDPEDFAPRHEGTPLWGWAIVAAMAALAMELALLAQRQT